MATKAAQLAEWLKELQDRVDADGNLSYAEIMRFQQEKNLTKKQFDSILHFFMSITSSLSMMMT